MSSPKREHKVERVKRERDGLDALVDLLRYAPGGFAAIPEDDLEVRLRWYGLYTQRPKEAGLFMLRVKIPNGTVTPDQLEALGNLSIRYGDNTGDITIRGFEEGDASITVKGTSRVKGYIDVDNQFNVSLSGKCSLELAGKGGQMDVSMNDGATLEAINWRARDVEITASDASKARVHAEQDALVISDANSQVKVEGGARIRNARYE